MNTAESTTAEFTKVHIFTTTVSPGEVLVITTTRLESGEVLVHEGVFDSARKARRYCDEEPMWGNCLRVQCPALGIDERGTFA